MQIFFKWFALLWRKKVKQFYIITIKFSNDWTLIMNYISPKGIIWNRIFFQFEWTLCFKVYNSLNFKKILFCSIYFGPTCSAQDLFLAYVLVRHHHMHGMTRMNQFGQMQGRFPTCFITITYMLFDFFVCLFAF